MGEAAAADYGVVRDVGVDGHYLYRREYVYIYILGLHSAWMVIICIAESTSIYSIWSCLFMFRV